MKYPQRSRTSRPGASLKYFGGGVLTNYPEGQVEWLEAVNNPERPEDGTRKVPFGRELFIEQDDFQEVPPPCG